MWGVIECQALFVWCATVVYITEASFFHLKEGRDGFHGLCGCAKEWYVLYVLTYTLSMCLRVAAACVIWLASMHGNPIFTLIEKAISIPRNSLCLQHQLLLSAFTVNSQLYMGYTLHYGTLTVSCRTVRAKTQK